MKNKNKNKKKCCGCFICVVKWSGVAEENCIGIGKKFLRQLLAYIVSKKTPTILY
jgi:hypothetical protein